MPAWNAPPASLDAWAEQLAALGHRPTIDRPDPEAAWLEVAPLRLRGYAVIEGGQVSAINFELHAPDPGPALALIGRAAEALGWELHEDDEDEDSD